MPRHSFGPLRGEMVALQIELPSLANNLLGDPTTRTVHVYLPKPWMQSAEKLPFAVFLAGYTSSGLRKTGWQAFDENLPQRCERMIASESLPAMALVFLDGFTSLGGNQYVDSPVFGGWETAIAGELVAALEQSLPIGGSRNLRAICGHSSGGYGAMIQAMRHPEVWGAVACHSADMAFDLLYRGDFPKVATTLARRGLDPKAFIEAFWAAPKVAGDDFHTLMTLAMAASYDPDANAPYGVRLPFDRHTGSLIEERWQAWLSCDPVVLASTPAVQENLRLLNGLFFDCGSYDQYHSQYGARQLAAKLQQHNLAHVYEEFPDGHSGVDYRLERSLPWICATLARKSATSQVS